MSTPSSAAGTETWLSPEARADVQGWVTSGFGHLKHSAYAFVRIGNAAMARRWLEGLISEVTSASSWRPAPGIPKRPPPVTLNVGFTASGLAAIGLGERCRETFPPEFLEGMAEPARSRALGDVGDSAPERWQFGGLGCGIDAVLVISAGSETFARIEIERHLSRLESWGGGVRVQVEMGTIPDSGREHFGFRDGIARLGIQGITGNGARTGEFILGYENEYGFHPPTPLVPGIDDPNGILAASPNPYHLRDDLRDFGLNGTYLVYRKLEQDVAGFWGFLEAETRRTQRVSDPRHMIELASKLVGRWPGGAPLTLSPEFDDASLGDADDFGYATTDGEGLRCPFGAHIRRSNPRDQLRPAGPDSSRNMAARHRLLRRGKRYGPELFDLNRLNGGQNGDEASILTGLRPDSAERGLHFFCLNASIKGQFEFMQQSWANNPHFNGLTGNRDGIIGAGNGSSSEGPSSLLVPREGLDLRTAPLPRFVTVRAGGYFFIPSLRALRYLAGVAR